MAGAIEAIRPVLDLSPDQRIHGIASSVGRVHDALVRARLTSVEAVELQEEAEDFQRTALPGVADQ